MPFELVDFDVWGPYPIMFPTGFKYFVTFVDDFSHMTKLYLMKNRSELFSHLLPFVLKLKLNFMYPFKY